MLMSAFLQKLSSWVILFDGFTKIWLFSARNVLENVLALQKSDDIIENLLIT